jgi:integrase/recombinase XerD
MSPLAGSLRDYLAMRRALGFKLERQGALLADFVGYMDRAGAPTITTELAVGWATRPAGADPSWPAARLSAVRGFARHLSAFDPATEIPQTDLLASNHPRATPYLYSADDVAALIAAAGETRSALLAATYRTLIGLLAVTGMRVGEAISLDRGDLDRDEGLLVVRDSKFGKSREVALHPSTFKAISAYTKLRDRLCPNPSTPAFLISTTGTRLIYKNVHQRFHRLTATAGLRPRSATCRPRPHDLRHTFAVNTLLGWYRTGVDVQARLPLLSTYLGHIHPGSTYWYLSATPELLALAADRLHPIGPIR